LIFFLAEITVQAGWQGRPVMARVSQIAADHREAVRLSRVARHVPVRTILAAVLIFLGVCSALSMVWAYGPVNSLP
jgi:hypothetical protein